METALVFGGFLLVMAVLAVAAVLGGVDTRDGHDWTTRGRP